MPVDQGKTASIDDKLGLCLRFAHAGLQARGVPGKPHDTVGLVAPQIGLDQRVCAETGVGFAQTGRDVDGCSECQEPIGINSGNSDHRNSPIPGLSRR